MNQEIRNTFVRQLNNTNTIQIVPDYLRVIFRRDAVENTHGQYLITLDRESITRLLRKSLYLDLNYIFTDTNNDKKKSVEMAGIVIADTNGTFVSREKFSIISSVEAKLVPQEGGIFHPDPIKFIKSAIRRTSDFEVKDLYYIDNKVIGIRLAK